MPRSHGAGRWHLVGSRLRGENVVMAIYEPIGDDERRAAAPPSKRGLGDLTEGFFMSLGITKERYLAAKAALGFDPECNCDARKKWLNELGGRLGVDGVVLKMSRWLDRRKS